LLTLPLEDGETYERSFTIPSPTSDAEVLFRVLHTHLESLQLAKRPTGVRLLVEPVRPEHQQFRLFESALRDPNRFGETIARLGALVGVENVGVAEIADSHRPDDIRLIEPRFHEMGEGNATPSLNLAIGLPLRRFRPPIPADVRLIRQQPVQVTSTCANGRVVDLLGPYRASGDWWERDQWSVEEWDVEIDGKGLFRLRCEPTGWFIEGCYDADACAAPSRHVEQHCRAADVTIH
jgi:protein ImuB